ncbi:hypothetical protein PHJA_001640900 [Phtheirospermum japonicum]|uniref:SANTA domain-containing protein n=1 Tax=Phtheirospermum japonicum TaxID=374723 RepID=A0A830CIL4_9LAMI|nr:hypothetical protein PHJA_001640900 [Phtheirospermum japonicum]
MASASTPHNHKHSGNMLNSHFNPTVYLSDWWLVKTEDDVQRRRLAVAGFASRGSHAMRVFSSAPILKRHNDFNIETTDGICVVFEGYINKVRTEQNGFPSNVYDHFVFGFPPYWKEYEENLMDKESSSEDTLGFTRLKSPLPPRFAIESGQPHVDNCAEDLESQQKSKKTVSSAVSSPEKPDSVISDPENNFIISGIAPEGLEKESYSRGPTVEQDLNISVVTDKFADDSQVDANRGVLLACKLHSKSTDDLSKVGLDKINSSQEILSHTEGRARTRSMNNSEMKQKNNEKSVGEKIRSKFVSSMGSKTVEKVTHVDREPDQGRNNFNFEAFEFHSCPDKMKPSEFGTPKVKNKGNIKKAKAKETRSMGTAAASADNQVDNVTPDTNNETPDREKDEVRASPQCRLLMPILEFWRNQRAIYGSDRTITGIEEGRIHPDPQMKGMYGKINLIRDLVIM